MLNIKEMVVMERKLKDIPEKNMLSIKDKLNQNRFKKRKKKYWRKNAPNQRRNPQRVQRKVQRIRVQIKVLQKENEKDKYTRKMKVHTNLEKVKTKVNQQLNRF